MEKNAVNNERLFKDAYNRGLDYIARWRVCAPAAFAAVMDSLGYSGDERIESILSASIGLSGGTGFMSVGTCGAVAGAALAVSFCMSVSREDMEKDINKTLAVNAAIAEIGKKVQKKYGHIQCQEIQFNHWGKSFRFTHPGAMMEFAEFSSSERSGFKCREVVGNVSRWTVEFLAENNLHYHTKS